VRSLTTNWRSSAQVVGFVNDVFRDRIDGYEDQQVKPGANEGCVEVVRAEEDVLETAAGIVDTLLKRGAGAEEIAILTATNKDADAVKMRLERDGVAVVTETTSKLISVRRVQALIAYLKYCYFGEEIYRRAFFALSDLEEVPLARRQIGAGEITAALRDVIASFGLFDGDMNIVRFLGETERFADLEAFLFEYERIDTHAVGSAMKGVRVLTVHKSKGLEFQYVIVLDRLGRKNSGGDPIVFDYEGVRLRRLYLRQKNRAELDPDYAAALAREKALAEDDELNALYVAFTRAVEQLYVVMKEKDSKFERLGLSEQRRGRPDIAAAERDDTPPPAFPDYEPQRLGRQREVVTRETSAYAPDDHAAIALGSALHYVLEMIGSFEQAALPAALEAARNRYGDVLDAAAFESIGRRVGRLLDDAHFRTLCRGKVFREHPLIYDGALRYLDLLVNSGGEWVVIDYKSAGYGDTVHRAQVENYVEAMRTITGDAVQGWLCYLLEEEIRWLRV